MAKKIDFSEIEAAVDQGQIGLAQKRLFELKPKLHLFSRPERLTYAKLARRSELSELCLSVLKTYFIAENSKQLLVKPRPDEILQYGTALINLGAYAEGLKELDRIDPKELPQSIFFKAFAHMRRSEWLEVIPLIEEYCKAPEITEEQQIWGLNYLAQAHTIGRFDDATADKILASAQRRLKKGPQGMLLSNTILLRAQAAHIGKRYRDAKAFIDEIEANLPLTPGSYFHTTVLQWKVLIDSELARENLKNSKPDLTVVARLREISEYFHKSGHFENSRTCQMYLAQYANDLDLFKHIYLGTPYTGYRKRIEIIAGQKLEFPEEYSVTLPTFSQNPLAYSLGDQTTSAKVYQLWGKKKSKWNPPVVPQKLFECLLTDFFKPQRTAEILSALFPSEQYLPLSTPNRIHQLLHRLKSSFKEAKIPITIEHRDGAFYLSTVQARPLLLNVPTDLLLNPSRATRPSEVISNPAANAFETFRRHLNATEFTLAQVQTQFDVSKRTAYRWVEQWIKSSWVQSSGAGYLISDGQDQLN